MKLFIAFAVLSISTVSFAASKTIAQCAVNEVQGWEGARINLLQNPQGQYKANLIFGTTVSGTSYQVSQTSPGVFVGQIRNRPEFTIRLVISKTAKANRYINGQSASLEAVYPDVNSRSGSSSVRTRAQDEFTCGKKIANF